MSSQPQTLHRNPENNPGYPLDQSSSRLSQLWNKLHSKWVSRRKKQMVGWYNPVRLAKTGRDVFISTIVGRHSDRRLVEALTAEEAFVYDYRYEGPFRREKMMAFKGKDGSRDLRGQRDEIWIDYVADVGDGWNSTYGVAYWLAQDRLQLPLQLMNAGGAKHDLPRGDVLIFGGDQVYPMASREEYEYRLVKPYRDALDRKPDATPQAYAIPGNHDWYDSLAAFTNLFCDQQTEHFAGGRWEAPQNRSYFALRLPGKWWLIGLDLQLSSDLDALQIQYLRMVAENMEEGDRVILCSPEPYWIYQIAYGENDTNKETRLSRGYLEQHIFGPKKISLYLAGDLHHYFHLEQNGTHKITAGGGGAFMHPTHGEFGASFDRKMREMGEKEPTRYPAKKDSTRISWANVLFPFFNPLFGIVTSILYLLTAWSVMGAIPRDGSTVSNLGGAWYYTLRGLAETPIPLMWMVLILAGFLMFTDTHSILYRYLGGLCHGAVHLVMVFCVGWAAYLVNPWQFSDHTDLSRILSWGMAVLLGGYLTGSFVMGLYLLTSINLFGRHSNEAFSSLRTQDWKNFLRMKIDKEGNLTIYPIGIRRVPRKWRERRPDEAGVSKYQPAGTYSEPELIEDPIRIR